MLIAHRLSTVVDADHILVMGHGAVIEAGTHAELVAMGGEYAALWAMQQAQGYEEVALEADQAAAESPADLDAANDSPSWTRSSSQ